MMNTTKQTNQEIAKVVFDKIASAKERALSQALATGQITYDTYVKVIEPLVEAQMLLLQQFEDGQDWIARKSVGQCMCEACIADQQSMSKQG